MIRIRLDYLLLDRRMKLTDVAAKTGIALNNLSVLKTNKARAIRFSTLEAICRAMDCTPGQLIEYVPEAEVGAEAETEEPETNPLRGESGNAIDDPA